MNRRSVLLAASIVAILGLSGCATSAPGTPVGSPEPTSVSTPAVTPTPTPSPTAEPTVVAFEGECENVLSDEQVESILGPGAEPFAEWIRDRNPDYRISTSGPAARAGGIECRWMAADDADGLPEGMDSIAVFALPADRVSPAEAAALEDARCDPSYDAYYCRLARAAGDVWLMSRAGSFLESAPENLLVAALDAAEANLASFPSPVAAEPDASWWAIGDCAELGVAMGLADLLGPDFHTGYWEGSPQHEDLLLEYAGVRQFCQWSSDSAGIPEGEEHYIVSLTLEPGGHWRWSDIASGDLEPVEVSGADEGLRKVETSDEDFTTGDVWVTDGTNVLHVGVAGGDVDLEIAERALAAMD